MCKVNRILSLGICLVMIAISMIVITPAVNVRAETSGFYESESTSNTLAGSAVVTSQSTCSGGNKVGMIGNNSGEVTINNVNAPSTGSYGMTICYQSNTQKSFYVSVNGGTGIQVVCPAGSLTNYVSYKGVTISLNAGNNTIRFYNNSASAPDLDRIIINEGTFIDESGATYDYSITKSLERPSIIDYTKIQTTKMVLSLPNATGGTSVRLTFEQALQKIIEANIMDRGVPKIVYLVGWQYNGHDDKYPAFFEVNPALKRAQDATALDSLKWLINEAKKYNTTVSFHTNMTDAYDNSPLWSTYVENDLLCRNSDGSFKVIGYNVNNKETMYEVCWTREWETGYAKKRIDDFCNLLDMLDIGTIHLDAFITRTSDYHGITNAQEEEAQRKIFRYWRDKGVDVTSEFVEQIGLQPMVWWYMSGQSPSFLGSIPATLLCGGEFNTANSDYAKKAFIFGESAHQEENFSKAGFEANYIRDFCTKTLPFYYLNSYSRTSYSNYAQTYSNNIVADANTWTVTQNGNSIRTNDNVFIPALWITDHREIIAYSATGYTNTSWELPVNWSDVTNVDTYNITKEGYIEGTKNIPVSNGNVLLSVGAGKAFIVVPAGTSIPIYTPPAYGENIALNKTVTVSSSVAPPSHAVDGNYTQGWVANGGTFPQWLKVDLGASATLNTVKQLFGETDNTTFCYKIEGSNDDSNWTMLADRTMGVTGNSRIDLVSGRYRYVRLTVTNMNNNHWANSVEFEVFGDLSTEMKIPHSQMTATATSQHVGNEGSKAIDDNNSTMWHSEWTPMVNLPQSVTLNLGASCNVSKVTYLPRQDSNSNGVITGYKVYISTDGNSFTQVATGIWANDKSEKTASVTPVTATYVKFEATAGYGGYASVAEINVYKQ